MTPFTKKSLAKKSLAAAVGLALLSGLLGPVGADPVPVRVRPAPALASGVWVNGPPTTVAEQRGRIIVLLFWKKALSE